MRILYAPGYGPDMVVEMYSMTSKMHEGGWLEYTLHTDEGDLLATSFSYQPNNPDMGVLLVAHVPENY